MSPDLSVQVWVYRHVVGKCRRHFRQEESAAREKIPSKCDRWQAGGRLQTSLNRQAGKKDFEGVMVYINMRVCFLFCWFRCGVWFSDCHCWRRLIRKKCYAATTRRMGPSNERKLSSYNARQNIGQKFVVTVTVRESDQTSNVTCTYVCSCNSPSSKKGKIEKSTYSRLMEYIFLFIIY